MQPQYIIQALKNILTRDIARYQSKVKDSEELSFTNGLLTQSECILQTIKNYEEMKDL